MHPDDTGLLIIRAWVEQGSSKPLRAQIRLTTDVAAGFAEEITLVDVNAVAAAVEAWLEDVLTDQGAAGEIAREGLREFRATPDVGRSLRPKEPRTGR